MALMLSRCPTPFRLMAFIGLLALLWLPVYGLLPAIIPNTTVASILVMVVLFVEFLGLTRWWNRVVHQCDRPWQRYGLDFSKQNRRSFGVGFGLGVVSLFTLFLTQSMLGWLEWVPPNPASPLPFVRLAVEGLVVAVAIALGEELVFRGWLLDELERDYSLPTALWSSSVIFGALHFIKPLSEVLRTLPQLPGLVLLGLILVWAKRAHYGQLGISIGLHAGLVWAYYLINVGNLVESRFVVSDWWSGVDQNPLAGFLGLGFLGVLALWFSQRAIVAIRE